MRFIDETNNNKSLFFNQIKPNELFTVLGFEAASLGSTRKIYEIAFTAWSILAQSWKLKINFNFK